MGLQRIKERATEIIKEEGFKEFAKRGIKYVGRKFKVVKPEKAHEYKDVLFINGCGLPHPQRYRVDHQIEQLEAYGITCARVDYELLNLDLVKYFRAFVIYRCPITPTVEEFVKKARENNKALFYDIDDLVFDLEYTKYIKYVSTLEGAELDLYNDGVKRMGETLKLCDYGIATTKRLQTEMGKHLKDVYINRNVGSEEMIYHSQKAMKSIKRDESKIIMGYLSGSITHNDDFKLIMPAILEVMEKYDNLYLQIVGLLDLPEEMKKFEDRVLTAPFMSWKKLPELICSIDINLAPLEESIFNEAKSENKWMEAGLCKVPTVASDTGAFKEMMEDGKTGLLCKNTKEWVEKLSKLIEDKDYREKIGNAAYDKVMKDCVTMNTGLGLSKFIMSKLSKNIAIVLPSVNISGGTMVAIKHAQILKKHGYDVVLINAEKENDNIVNEDGEIYVISQENAGIYAKIDTMVATMWVTVPYVRMYPNCDDKRYLVQNLESEFYPRGDYQNIMASATYNVLTNFKYLTISKWCQDWLKEKFDKESLYAPNGIDTELFKPSTKKRFTGKTKILIEGNSKSHYKNVDEAFKITNMLDKNKYEVHYLSYDNEPKKWYQYDKFYQRVPHNEVSKIYEQCDILLKTSILESFSYPPLEMMATGGVCVVLPNGGNVEYLKDNENCLFYERENYEQAIEKIESIVNDKKLRDKLIKNGYKTVESREWKNVEKEIVKLYE